MTDEVKKEGTGMTGSPALGGKPEGVSANSAGQPTATIDKEAPAPPKDAGEIAQGLKDKGVTAGGGTAAAVAIAEAARGKVEHHGEEPENVPTKNDQGPIGEQLNPAAFLTSGSLPAQQIASPTGLVPATLVGDADKAQALVDQRDSEAFTGGRKYSRARVSEDTIRGMSGASLRAVAHDRGYDIGEGGRRLLQDRFINAQDDDEYVEKAK